jgi:antitoxin (DNA-binding transcriptional repressor) of toxin-antitoxin stability system
MKTVTAKHLRDNLQAISLRAAAGEHIIVEYRNKALFQISPIHQSVGKRQPLQGLEALRTAPRKKPYLDKNVSIKDLYERKIHLKYAVK